MMTKRMKVLVTGADQHQGLAVVRGLGLAGYHVIAGGPRKDSLAFYSRYATERFVYRSPVEDKPRFISDVLGCLQQTRPSLIIPVVESTLVALNEVRPEIEQYTTLAAPSAVVLEYAVNKSKTLRLAERLKVPVPRTVQGSNPRELLERAAALRLPVAIKPQGSRLHRSTASALDFKVRYARTLDELAGVLAPLHGYAHRLLVQEYVPGIGRCVSAVCRQGEPVVLFAYSRDRNFPLSGGVSVLRRSIALDPPLKRYVTALLREIRWHGVAMVEFKYDPHDDRYTLMEINGRFQASTALSLDAGLNLPDLVARLFSGREIRSPGAYRVGVEERWLEGDLLALRDYLMGPRPEANGLDLDPREKPPSKRSVVRRFITDFRPGVKYDEFKWHDWKPGVIECRALLRIALEWVKEGVARTIHPLARRMRNDLGSTLAPRRDGTSEINLDARGLRRRRGSVRSDGLVRPTESLRNV
jgi:predicted ATP-grasp superfamily ATP-dependent carboligase